MSAVREPKVKSAVTRTASAAATPPPPTKILSMRVVPTQISTLSFEVGGVLGEFNAVIGGSVDAFDFATFYATVGSRPTLPNDPGRLLYDPLVIQAAVQPFTLAALRAENNKAALFKAISARANAFYAKYSDAPAVVGGAPVPGGAIIAKMREFYSPSVADSKPARLDILAGISQLQFQQLANAYFTDGRTGVVRTTESQLSSHLDSTGSSTTTGRSDDVGVGLPVSGGTVHAPPAGGGLESVTFGGGTEDIQMGSSLQTSTSTGSADETQTITNKDYGYRIPLFENQAQFQRAQVSLIDERFAQFMSGQNLPFLEAVFFNELLSIDSDVYRTQIAYLNTILMSPISGTITGVYKNSGDAVRPGEPVLRVENDAIIYLWGTVVNRGPISIGALMEVSTSLFDSGGPSKTTISGNLTLVRGLEQDDHWEVVAQCANTDDSGNRIFPLGYHFDYDNITVTITN